MDRRPLKLALAAIGLLLMQAGVGRCACYHSSLLVQVLPCAGHGNDSEDHHHHPRPQPLEGDENHDCDCCEKGKPPFSAGKPLVLPDDPADGWTSPLIADLFSGLRLPDSLKRADRRPSASRFLVDRAALRAELGVYRC